MGGAKKMSVMFKFLGVSCGSCGKEYTIADLPDEGRTPEQVEDLSRRRTTCRFCGKAVTTREVSNPIGTVYLKDVLSMLSDDQREVLNKRLGDQKVAFLYSFAHRYMASFIIGGKGASIMYALMSACPEQVPALVDTIWNKCASQNGVELPDKDGLKVGVEDMEEIKAKALVLTMPTPTEMPLAFHSALMFFPEKKMIRYLVLERTRDIGTDKLEAGHGLLCEWVASPDGAPSHRNFWRKIPPTREAFIAAVKQVVAEEDSGKEVSSTEVHTGSEDGSEWKIDVARPKGEEDGPRVD